MFLKFLKILLIFSAIFPKEKFIYSQFLWQWPDFNFLTTRNLNMKRLFSPHEVLATNSYWPYNNPLYYYNNNRPQQQFQSREIVFIPWLEQQKFQQLQQVGSIRKINLISNPKIKSVLDLCKPDIQKARNDFLQLESQTLPTTTNSPKKLNKRIEELNTTPKIFEDYETTQKTVEDTTLENLAENYTEKTEHSEKTTIISEKNFVEIKEIKRNLKKTYKNCQFNATEKLDGCFYQKMKRYWEYLSKLIFPKVLTNFE